MRTRVIPQSRHALELGRAEEAERLSREVYDIANKVLVQRPGDFRAMQNRLLAAGMLERAGLSSA